MKLKHSADLSKGT